MSQRATCAPSTPKPFRRVGVSVSVVSLIIALTGCAFGGSGGQSKKSADAALSAIPGVSSASVDTESMVSGLQEETSTTIKVSLETGYSVPEPDALVDYLLRVAWSSKTKEADSFVEVIVLSDPQISIADALDAGEWVSVGSDPKNPEDAVVQAGEVKDRFGDWPGDVPELPEGLIVGPTPEPAP